MFSDNTNMNIIHTDYLIPTLSCLLPPHPPSLYPTNFCLTFLSVLFCDPGALACDINVSMGLQLSIRAEWAPKWGPNWRQGIPQSQDLPITNSASSSVKGRVLFPAAWGVVNKTTRLQVSISNHSYFEFTIAVKGLLFMALFLSSSTHFLLSPSSKLFSEL